MMVRGRLSVGLNNYGTSPQLTGPGTRLRDGGCPCHSRTLGRVGVQLPRAHNFHAVLFPVQTFTLFLHGGTTRSIPATRFRRKYAGRAETQTRRLVSPTPRNNHTPPGVFRISLRGQSQPSPGFRCRSLRCRFCHRSQPCNLPHSPSPERKKCYRPGPEALPSPSRRM